MGPMGPAGADGAQGLQGERGLDGAAGPQGPQGERGLEGAAGAQGPTGPQGTQGERGADGEQGPQGLTGPQGPTGPTGPSGMALRAEHSWMTSFAYTEMNVWVLVPDSQVDFYSDGGPLLISIDMTMKTNGQAFGCRPIVDGQWAGFYGGFTYIDRWTEGLTRTESVWQMWAKTRVYTGIGQGNHTLGVECRKDMDLVAEVGTTTVPQSVSVLEMH